MEHLIFMDESGNTGDIKFNPDTQRWNFAEQPHFALGAVYFENKDGRKKKVENDILSILQKYNPNLGTEVELKAKLTNNYSKDLLKDLIDYFQKENIKTFVDITNKKYKVMNYIVDYCVYPYYIDIDRAAVRQKLRAASKYLYYNLSDELLVEWYNLCYATEQIREKMMDFSKKIENIIRQDKLFSDVDFTKIRDKIQELDERNLVPLKSHTNKGKNICFLPNEDAFVNIIGTIYNVKLKGRGSISIYHDVQDQFSNTLEDWKNYICEKNGGIVIDQMLFLNSKKEVLIQVADFITGTILHIFQKISYYNNPLTYNDREILKSIKPLVSENCNIVSVEMEQEEFFGKFGLKTRPSILPY